MSNVTRIRRFGIVNVFLVQEDDGLTVIDTALPGTQKRILMEAKRLDQPIKRIVLTHAHGDHIGSLDKLAAAVPEAEVIISTRDARLLKKDLTMDEGEPDVKIRGGIPGAETEPTRLVDDGDMIGSLRVISTPGHTPGHISLIDVRDDSLFAGDVFSTLGGMATTAKVNPLFPFPTTATWHKPTEIESAVKLLELKPARLAPGHGRVVESPTDDMEIVIAKAQK